MRGALGAEQVSAGFPKTDEKRMEVSSLLSEMSSSIPHELSEVLVRAKTVRIERIISHGHASPPDFWYDQDECEFVLLVQGGARLRFDDEVVEMKGGDWINIQAHKRHRVEWTTPDEKTIWLAVFYE